MKTRLKPFGLITVLTILFALATVSCDNQSKSNQTKEATTAPVSVDMTSAAEDAYIFGLGPEAMYKWFQQFGVVENGINQLNYYPSFPKPGDLPGGSANNDTFYGKGWFDLSVGPYVVSLPDFGDRYYVFQMTDIYGYDFMNIGNKLSSDQKEEYKKAYTFALVPPGWEGELPEGVARVESPVRLVNVLYRIQVGNEKVEGPIAKKLQDQTLLLPLEDWKAGKRENIQKMPPKPVPTFVNTIKVGASVVAADQRDIQFFVMLDKLIRFDPPWNEWDKKFVANNLAPMGIGGEVPFDPGQLSADQKNQFLDGIENGFKQVQKKIRNVGIPVNGWQYTDPNAGLYKDDFVLRAAMVYTGGMYPSMQVSRYANLSIGPDGQPLKGLNPMTLTFPADDMPPATSFWSFTLYGMGTYDLVENPINRYLFSSVSEGVQKDADGNMTIYIQNEKPSADKLANWLPAPKGDYFLLFRWYAPTKEVINLDYKLPAISNHED